MALTTEELKNILVQASDEPSNQTKHVIEDGVHTATGIVAQAFSGLIANTVSVIVGGTSVSMLAAAPTIITAYDKVTNRVTSSISNQLTDVVSSLPYGPYVTERITEAENLLTPNIPGINLSDISSNGINISNLAGGIDVNNANMGDLAAVAKKTRDTSTSPPQGHGGGRWS